MKLGKLAIYVGRETSEYENGEELLCVGINYDDEVQPSYTFKSVENGTIEDLYEYDIEWIGRLSK